MEKEEFTRKFTEFAEWMMNFHGYDYVEIVPSVGIADFYRGINTDTYSFEDDVLAFNRTISDRQIKMLEENPNLFMSLDSRYFMDNENTDKFSQIKSNRLLTAATKGLKTIDNEEERANLCDKIRERYEQIKKDALEIVK